VKKMYALAATLIAMAAGAQASEKIAFPSRDGLELSADLYLAHPLDAPFVLLFHMAGSSRGEYLAIAGRLNELGFNAMALDQRSGKAWGGLANESAARARKAKLKTGYIDALPDMEAALALARQKYARGKVLLWGSSYSASLVLKMAGDSPACCDAVLAFSPGEYFGGASFIAGSARKIALPVFISSAKSEKDDWAAIYEAIPAPGKASFVPTVEGAHGSPALEPGRAGSEEYWAAAGAFLAKLR
jgi:dienelactone hydrolase